jgi:hypothetical protein
MVKIRRRGLRRALILNNSRATAVSQHNSSAPRLFRLKPLSKYTDRRIASLDCLAKFGCSPGKQFLTACEQLPCMPGAGRGRWLGTGVLELWDVNERLPRLFSRDSVV